MPSRTPQTDRQALTLIEAASRRHGQELVVSTSFGIHSAAMLHLATEVAPGLPVVWVDTGYLPAETYRFAEDLIARLDLNLHVAQPELSPARMEAVHGRLWERGDLAALDLYDRIRKVEPMHAALDQLGATGWLAGLRAEQTAHRKTLSPITEQWGREKFLPMLDWSTRDVHGYLTRHDLPLHPLFEEGYASVGDWHTSRPVHEGDPDERSGRFLGLKQECGIHVA